MLIMALAAGMHDYDERGMYDYYESSDFYKPGMYEYYKPDD